MICVARVDRQQRARVAHVDVARHQHRLHRLGQVQQAQQVRHRAARAADRLRRLFVREAELVIRRCNALRFFQRIQVLALDVLDQRHRGGGLVVARRAPAPALSSRPASWAARKRRSPAMIS